ncbi:Golgi reassembly-stacking protein 2, partial [Nosema granulosis]
MGNESSKIKTLQIVKISPDSVCHKNNLLPFMHTILRYNGKKILENADIAKLAFEWEENELKLDLLDLRTELEFSVTVPKKNKEILGMSVKFHDSIIPLFTIHVISVSKGSPAQECGLVPKDYIIGVEGVSCETETILLKYIELKKKEGMTLLVFNDELNYIRQVNFIVPSGLGFYGCEIGLGMLYRIPHDKRNISMEYDSDKIKRETEALAKKYEDVDVEIEYSENNILVEEKILEDGTKSIVFEGSTRDVDDIAEHLSDYKEEIEAERPVEEENVQKGVDTNLDNTGGVQKGVDTNLENTGGVQKGEDTNLENTGGVQNEDTKDVKDNVDTKDVQNENNPDTKIVQDDDKYSKNV